MLSKNLLGKRILLFAISLYAIFCPSMGHSQCNPTILNLADDNPYMKYRDFGNRCEGFYKATVSTSILKIVSFTQGSFHFKKDVNEVILVSLPFHPHTQAQIVAQGIPMKLYYRMDADLKAGETLKWPVKDIIGYSFDLTSEQIGIMALIDIGDNVYIPVKARSKLMKPSSDTSLRLIVKASLDIAKFLWRTIYQPETGNKIIGTYQSPENDRPVFRSGQAIILKILDEDRVSIDLELAARPANETEWIKDFVTINLGEK